MLIENLSTGKKTHMLPVHAKTLIAKGTHKQIVVEATEPINVENDIEVVEEVEATEPIKKTKKAKK